MKTKFFYGMTALATLGLAACTADELAPSAPGQVAEADMTRYISVNISAPSVGGTRAEDPTFSEGEDFESAVKDAYFVFYDENDKVVGDIVNVTDLEFTKTESSDPTASEHSNANKVIGVSILKGQNLPKKVLVYLNPQTQSGILNPLNVIETITRSDVKKTGGDVSTDNPKGWLFSMSNAVYFDENSADADPAKKGKLCNIAEIPLKGLFNTEKEAQTELDKALGNKYTNENGEEVTPTPEVKEEAAKKVTTIYVERYAAKVQFKWLADGTEAANPVYGGDADDDENIVKTYTYKDENGTTTVTSQTVKLTFEPFKWDVNAESNEMYVIKTFRSSDALGGFTANNLTYSDAMGTEADPLLGKNDATQNWVWNKQSLHRSFWGCSPSYYSTTYPEVSSDYFNEATEEVNKEMKLKYLTWNELKEDGHDVQITPNVDYVKETTVGNLGLHTANNKYASLPSIIVTGTYKLSYGATGTEQKIDDPTTFYLYGTGADSGKGVFFEAEVKNNSQTLESAVKDKDGNSVGSSLLYRLATRQNIVRMKETVTTTVDGKTTTTTTVRNLTKDEMAKIFKIDRPTQDVLNVGAAEVGKDVKLAARKFTVQLTNTLTFIDKTSDDGNSITKYELVYNDGTGDHLVVVAENPDVVLNKVNNMLLRNVGYADKYKNGMAYYNIPIKHYGWYRTGNENNKKDENGRMVEIDWAKTRVGDFGVVRNHLYNIEISKVEGLATAISSETTPIVPPQETDKHYVAYRLYILNWAVVPTQNEEL